MADVALKVLRKIVNKGVILKAGETFHLAVESAEALIHEGYAELVEHKPKQAAKAPPVASSGD